MSFPGWTMTVVAELERLHAEGLTTGQIASRLGCSRNAVIGKLHRIGQAGIRPAARPRTIKALAGGRSDAAPPPPRLLRPAPRRTPPAPHLAVAAEPRPLVALDECACRWPVAGEGETTLFCAAWKPVERSYCDRHRAMAVHRVAPPIKSLPDLDRGRAEPADRSGWQRWG
jgi:GcrA cell cycle regulator